MIWNTNLIFYACVAKGSTILTQFSWSNEPGIETIGQRCIEKTPPHHSLFSHTIRNKTYTFLIDYPFAYFVIFDENLEKYVSLWFLNRVKTAFKEFISSNLAKDGDKLDSLCFQLQFYPIFREMLTLDEGSLMEGSMGNRNPSLDSSKGGKRMVGRPCLPKPCKVFMTKKKRSLGEVNGDHHLAKDAGNVGENGSRELSVSVMHKGGGVFYLGDSKQKAKQIWKKHVWIVLTLDLVVCAVLFGVWLLVCRGFKCIDG